VGKTYDPVAGLAFLKKYKGHVGGLAKA